MTTSTVDSDGLGSPYVIQVGSSFKMWYTCQNPLLSVWAICYATSTDGISWTKQSSPVLQSLSGWEAGSIGSPSVIYDGTVYGMWYGGSNSASYNAISQLGYATSKDGVSWTRDPDNPILSPGPSAWDAGGVISACAVQYNGGYLLYYDGFGTSQTSPDYIGLAQSPANFALPETTSPLLTAGIIMLFVVTCLSLYKRRLSL